MYHRDPKIKLARDFMSHVWLEGGHQSLNDFLIPQVLVKSPVKQSVGGEKLSDALSIWFRGFPNLQYRENTLQIYKDRVNIEWEVKGDHLGEFLGVAATGKPVRYSGTTDLVMFDQKIHAYCADVQVSSVVEQISPAPYVAKKALGDDMYLAVNRLLHLNLTNRQIDCLSLLCLRCDSRVISSKLNIKYSTFRTHVERTLPLIGLKSSKDVFDWALSSNTLEILITIALEKIC
ncbi:ester cyclase [Vibrio hepatarius]|uniref:ester cyclase n=1 Tax=Vibrio hepatarius TaxID=171383 RepID=UPI001C0A22CA|nr:ester cyclase [Vibrio hepatarius]MBU2895351.1 ester cyclase [Vibrio hepatarius]